MSVLNISEIIPESKIVVFSPHFDDFPFMLGGYFIELREQKLLDTKKIHTFIQFSKSNYTARSGKDNYDISPERIKFVTGNRLIEDMGCMDELLGEFNYRYELGGEKEVFVRGKSLADSEMEFSQGRFENFNGDDWQIFSRIKERIMFWAMEDDTAMVFPLAFKEHFDHFIVREAAIKIAKELDKQAKATFYFQEDKPYSGLIEEEELKRVEAFILENNLESRAYRHHPERVIELIFKHYLSQTDETFKKGIRIRGNVLRNKYETDFPCDQIFVFKP